MTLHPPRAFQLSPMPYGLSALEPFISERTLTFHREKHHQGYLDALNKLLQDTPVQGETLEELMRASETEPALRGVFNNAAQVWNHSFYWSSMTPQTGGVLQEGPLKAALEAHFHTLEAFKEAFRKAALGQFGSGWAWLVRTPAGGLEILTTPNAHCPLTGNTKPLMVCDVWEHAYYLDYQNRRIDYVQVFLDHLVNWSFAQDQFTTP